MWLESLVSHILFFPDAHGMVQESCFKSTRPLPLCSTLGKAHLLTGSQSWERDESCA